MNGAYIVTKNQWMKIFKETIVGINLFSSNKLKKFITVGITTVLIDLIVYYLLLIFSVEIPLAKLISFSTGAIYSYKINRSWTFNSGGGFDKFLKFALIYTLALFINVSLNSLILNILYDLNFFKIIIAFLISTFISATFNFIFLKNFVFKKNNMGKK